MIKKKKNDEMVAENTPLISAKWMHRLTTMAPLWTLIVLLLVFSIASETFARPINMINLLAQISTLAIFCTGMTFVLLLGEIDLSIGTVAALAAMLSTHMFANMNIAEPWPLLAGLGAATLFGFISGVGSTRFRIPTFMTTLALSLIAAGLTTYVSKGRVISNLSDVTRFLGSAQIVGPVKWLTIFAALTLLIGYIILRYTRFGRYVYMTGANKTAARLAGVNTNLVIIVVMTISGFTAGLAGIASTGRLGSAQPTEVPSYLINTIGAVVLGGTSLAGGRGGIVQTVFGLLIFGTLRNGLDNIPEIDVYLKQAIVGLVLFGALIINVLLAGRAPRDKTQ